MSVVVILQDVTWRIIHVSILETSVLDTKDVQCIGFCFLKTDLAKTSICVLKNVKYEICYAIDEITI